VSVAVHSAGRSVAFDVIVMAASLGGVSAGSDVLAGLPADFGVPILLVQHRTARVDDQLPLVLQSRSDVRVRHATHGQLLTPGVTVLPPGYSGTIGPSGRLLLQQSESFRTADPLLTSVAAHFQSGALCVVLTGRLDDAAVGVRAIRRHGGRTIVEDPRTARAGAMPGAAVATGCVDLVMPLTRIAQTMIALTMAPGARELFRTVPTPWTRMDLAA
jgi:two-component system, chemotaxis family, protein-glutamate methylesterase/glutaminase